MKFDQATNFIVPIELELQFVSLESYKTLADFASGSI